MSTADELDFTSITPVVVTVRFENAVLELTEADAGAVIAWEEAKAACRVIENGKVIAIKGLAETDLILLSKCLKDKDTKKSFTVADIKLWQDRVVQTLIEKLKMISSITAAVVPERTSLQKALDLPGAPCTFKQLQDWVMSVKSKDTIPAQVFLQPTAEELAKNS